MYRGVSSAEVLNGALVIHVIYGTSVMFCDVSSADVLTGALMIHARAIFRIK